VRPVLVSLPLSVAERAALDALKAAAGLGADADVLRLALWRLAAWYALPLPVETFAIGGVPARRGRKRQAAR
jgi:hypothetical protein